MDLAALEIFRTVVEAGGITRAAERLHRVQSNVTTRIRQLEESLGVDLFLRDGKRMVLTPAGQTLFDYACRMLRLAEEARHAVLPSRPHGRLRIASMESTAASRLPAVLAAYHQAWPDVQLELVTLATRQALEALERFDADCAFVAEPLGHPALVSRPAFEEELVVIARAGHRPIRSAADLESATLLGFEPGCNYRARLEAWHAAGGGTPPRVLELGSYHTIVACAAAGIGAAIVPRSVLGLYRDLPAISVHGLGEAGRVRTLLAWHPAMASAALDALVQALPAPDAAAGNPPLPAAA
ncbi:HTH-type transcriptional regulator GltR [Cupriavidus yeoncheonensis]|uniref:HTH-type transcriptional regulator GltR n=1 Tax=Cupriavidus yeoncheonensis TaxID=1462994 RepID=A0A916N4W4_9BURK|nr:LysR substrate-binding domain-containing protein [Cupriavidus yeoncheonensis]CAG2148241.1 HTH-type transcriptional regulator GltR [Cupriavidus yeoncheonensis]